MVKTTEYIPANETLFEQITFFSPEDFSDPNCPGSWRYMDARTIIRLEWLRRNTGWPIIPHSKYGIRGCVCVNAEGHAKNSRHYMDHPDGCSAIDWHFSTAASAREQAMIVLASGFRGIGLYYDWHWANKKLKIGFHVDSRERPQIWRRENGKYYYLLK